MLPPPGDNDLVPQGFRNFRPLKRAESEECDTIPQRSVTASATQIGRRAGNDIYLPKLTNRSASATCMMDGEARSPMWRP